MYAVPPSTLLKRKNVETFELPKVPADFKKRMGNAVFVSRQRNSQHTRIQVSHRYRSGKMPFIM